jgi:spore coat protein U-like protein
MRNNRNIPAWRVAEHLLLIDQQCIQERSRMNRFSKTFLTLTLTAACGWAYSGNSSTTMTVSATMASACSSVSATAISFGTLTSPIPANQDATGTISITCTSGTSYVVFMDSPSRSNGTGHYVLGNGSGGALIYDIFTPGGVAAGLYWGPGAPGSQGGGFIGVGTGALQSLTATGRITAGQSSIPAGNYSDTINVSVVF